MCGRVNMDVFTSEKKVIRLSTPSDFEQFFCLRYLSHLEFNQEKIKLSVNRRCLRALARGWITPRQRWLGAYYATSMAGSTLISASDLTIRWIDREIGYGVWTNRLIKARTFIGEYSGIVHKRHWWKRRENLYCFDYTVGPHRSTSLVIDSQDAGNHTRFINHSFCPNLNLVSVYWRGLIHVILYANRDIPADSQLLYDYGEEYWKKRPSPKEIF